MIELDLRTLLPKVREAFDKGELQAQIASGGCEYSGPCAIGVGLTPEQQQELDEVDPGGGAAICALFADVHVSAPEDQHEDFIALQMEHDNWSLGRPGHDRHSFNKLLTALEAKYGPL